MKILALEFSSAQRSAAIIDSAPEDAARALDTSRKPMLLGEAMETDSNRTQAFALIKLALKQAGLVREQIEGLAIGLGPGSYTGIRIAISIAQGWQLACDVRLLGLSSADCLAHQAQAAQMIGRVHVLLDAQRREFYLATYELTPDAVRVVEPLRLATLPEAQATCETSGTIVGPDVQPWFPTATVLFPHAATLARLAAGRTDSVPGEKLEPIYLRAAQFVKAPPPRIIPDLKP